MMHQKIQPYILVAARKKFSQHGKGFTHNVACVAGIILMQCFLFSAFSAAAQISGQNSFSFLDMSANARLSSLGGVNVSLADRDVNLLYSNPALTGDTLNGFASASYQFYVADIGQASFAYADNFRKIGKLAIGLQHVNYGTMTSYDATGQEIGDFSSSETALVVSRTHQVSAFRIGVNLKAVFSNIASYRANALLLDLGGVFIHPTRDWTVGLVIKNAGFILSDFSATSHSELPFDIQLGSTYKPEHMPLRFSIAAFNLTEAGQPYYSPAGKKRLETLDKVFRHFNFGTELLIHKNVNLMLGYNFLRKRDLKLDEGGGGAGISFGFSIAIKSVEFVFGRSGFVAGNAGYAFTLSSNLAKLLKR